MRNKNTSGSIQQRIRAGSWITMTLIVVTSVFLCSSLTLGRVSAWIPQVILSATLVLLLLQLAHELFGSKRFVLSGRVGGNSGLNPMLPALIWIVTMLLLVWLLGVTLGAALFCLAYLRWYASERWRVSMAFALGLGLGVQLLFGTLMQISLYPGFLLPFFN